MMANNGPVSSRMETHSETFFIIFIQQQLLHLHQPVESLLVLLHLNNKQYTETLTVLLPCDCRRATSHVRHTAPVSSRSADREETASSSSSSTMSSHTERHRRHTAACHNVSASAAIDIPLTGVKRSTKDTEGKERCTEQRKTDRMRHRKRKENGRWTTQSTEDCRSYGTTDADA